MPGLVDLLYPWPVVSSLASYLGIEDLFRLSRVNSEFRAVLHGFPRPKLKPRSQSKSKSDSKQLMQDRSMKEETKEVRPDIFVGMHQNSYWKHLKSITHMSCAEPSHRKGYHVGLCRYCSNPVCDACIVRESFAQQTSAWRTRTRHLCTECWATGNPHRSRNFTRPPSTPTSYTFLPGDGDFCRCTVHDGWLCAGCRKNQCTDAEAKRAQCVGEGCANLVGYDRERRSVCLWCDLPL